MFCEIIICDKRGGRTGKATDFFGIGDKTSEAKSGITGRILLKIGRFVRLVNDNQTEIFDRGEEGGAGADDDLRGFGL